MSEKELQGELGFHDIRKVEHDGFEHWSARELMIKSGYKDWRDFKNVIEKAKKLAS